MRSLILSLLCILMAVFWLGCQEEEAGVEDFEADLNVVTTIYPLADVIGELGGDKVKVSYLLPAGASPHTYEPTVEQALLIEQAQLFIHVGAGLDNWAVKLAEASGSGLVLVDLSKEVDLIEPADYRQLEDVSNAREDVHHDCDAEECDHDHHLCEHGPDDPHFWLDPLIVRDSICPAIYSQLIAIAPEKEDYFRNNYDQYRQEITALHEEIEEIRSGFSSSGFIAFHSAWQYFGRRYNLEEVTVIAGFPGQEPSAGWMAELIDLIETEDIGAIFAEPQFPTALADRIAEESGLEVRVLDPLGGEGVPDRESYLEIMRFNISSFREVME